MSDTSNSNKSAVETPASLALPDDVTFVPAVKPQHCIADEHPTYNTLKSSSAMSLPSTTKKYGMVPASFTIEFAADVLSGSSSAKKQKTPLKIVFGSNESTSTRRSSRLAKPKLFHDDIHQNRQANKPKKATEPAKPVDNAELATTKSENTEVDGPESPLAKKSIARTPSRAPSKFSKDKTVGKALPSGKRGDGITRMLREQKKFPKSHTPSTKLGKTDCKKPVVSISDDYDDYTTAATGKKEDALKVCENNPTNMGTSSVRPADADLDEPWCCANRGCSTGMTYFHRDAPGTEGFGRKAISDYLGRNKKETKSIDPEVWHTYCRKCYQRLHYAAGGAQGKNKTGLFNWHISNLRSQMQRLKAWRPYATFKAQLLKSMLDRSNQYQAILRRNSGNKAAALAEYQSRPNLGFDNRKANKKGELRSLKDEEAFPVDFTDIFIQQCCGPYLDYEDVDAVLSHIERMFDAETIEQMPPIEFLISAPTANELVINPSDNYIRWVEECEGTEATQIIFSDKADNDDDDDNDDYDEENVDYEGNDTSSEASTTIFNRADHGPLNNRTDDEIEAAKGLMLLGGLSPDVVAGSCFGRYDSVLSIIPTAVGDFANEIYVQSRCGRSNLAANKKLHSDAVEVLYGPPDFNNVPYYKPPGRLSDMRVNRKTDEISDEVSGCFREFQLAPMMRLNQKGIKRKANEIASVVSDGIGEDYPLPKRRVTLSPISRMADDVTDNVFDGVDESLPALKMVKSCLTQ